MDKRFMFTCLAVVLLGLLLGYLPWGTYSGLNAGVTVGCAGFEVKGAPGLFYECGE